MPNSKSGLHILRQLADIDEAARAQSDIAEAAIGALMPRLASAFAAQHGSLPGRGFAVVALGKFGGRELTATSDLDLVFLYECPGGDDVASDGKRSLSRSHYYQRLGQRVVTDPSEFGIGQSPIPMISLTSEFARASWASVYPPLVLSEVKCSTVSILTAVKGLLSVSRNALASAWVGLVASTTSMTSPSVVVIW